MRAIAKFAMRSPTAASVNAAAYAVFALVFAPLMVLSGAIVGLATLRGGFARGLQVAVSAALIAGIIYYARLREPMAGLLVGATWLPVLFAALTLRKTENQGLALSVCGGFAALFAVVTRILIPDMQAHWLARLMEIGESVKSQGGAFFKDDDVAVIASVMHEATLVMTGLFWITAVLLARWWQSALYNPGGFGSEFRSLVIPRVISPLAAVVAAMALLQVFAGNPGGLASDLLIVLVVLFAFQGLALLHHRVNKLNLARGWMAGLYVLLFLMPHRIGLILAIAGIADTILDVRGLRVRRPPVD